MKKYILPLVAVMFISAAANAQTTQKQSPGKTVAVAKPKSHTKTMSTESVTPQKPNTTTPANTVAIHKKHRHHKAKKAAKK
jgi:hypothetical protein